jgi:hypothetical protein
MDEKSEHPALGSVLAEGYRFAKITADRCDGRPRVKTKWRQSHSPTCGINVDVLAMLDFSIGKNSCTSA